MSVHICSAVTRNYLGFASVLAESVHRHNPGAQIDLLIVDGDRGELTAPAPPGVELLSPRDLAIDRDEFLRLAALYGPFEISNALKPTLMRTLLERGASHVLWVDADVVALGDLSDIPPAIERSGVLLTPHHLVPAPRVAHRTDYEMVALTAGTYNAGVVGAAGAEGIRMLSWWESRVARDCVHDQARGLFVDQRWLDLVPGMFGAHVLRDPGVNYGWWRTAASPVSAGADGPVVDGVPLRLLHLSGFDRHAPWLLSRHAGAAPIAPLSEMPALARIVDEYRGALERHHVDDWSRLPYGYGRFGRDSTPLDRRMRALYRESLVAFERGDLDREPPNPFASDDGSAFIEWLRRPDVLWAGEPTVGRHLLSLWEEREDLGPEFPDPRGLDAAAFSVWAARDGRRDDGVPHEVLPVRREVGSAPRSADQVLVLSVASRRPTAGLLGEQIEGACSDAGFVTTAVELSRYESPPVPPLAMVGAVVLVGVPADLRELYHRLGHFGRMGLPVVAVLDWASVVEPEVLSGMGRVRAVASPSRLLTRALAAEGVAAVELDVSFPMRRPDRHSPGEPPGRVRFGACIDCERRDEVAAGLGALSAYLRAVARPGDARFTLVGANVDRSPLPLEHARSLARTRADVRILEAPPGAALERALRDSDAFLSIGTPAGADVAALVSVSSGRPTVMSASAPNLDLLGDAGAFLVPVARDEDDSEPIDRTVDHIRTILGESAVWPQAVRTAEALQRRSSPDALAAALRATLVGVWDSHSRAVET